MIGHGRLLADYGMAEFIARGSGRPAGRLTISAGRIQLPPWGFVWLTGS